MPSAPNIRTIEEEDLKGLDIRELSCRSCSGYGNCGYKSYVMYEERPVSICNLQWDSLLGDAHFQE